MNRKRILLIPLLIFFIFSPAYCEDSKESTESESFEFPQWALYVRRTEIVTLGSLPFTSLGVTFAFGAYKYFSGATTVFPNPFDKSSSVFSEDDVKKIILISVSISAVIGIVDLIVTIVKNNNEARRLEKMNTSGSITIVPATDEEIEKFRQSKSPGADEKSSGSSDENAGDK